MSGLNDTLNQIEICRTYAERFGRILIVDGRQSGTLGDFGDYFEMDGDGHIFKMTDATMPDLDAVDCYPPEVRGRVRSVKGRLNPAPGGSGVVDAETGVMLSFPLTQDRPETLLLHQQWGGGTRSFDLIDRLTIVPEVAARVRRRISRLPVGYSALHIRNTDYTTDIGMVLAAIRDKVAGQDLVLCSDDTSVFPAMRAGLPDTRIHQITVPVFDGGRAQHSRGRFAGAIVRRRVVVGSIVDLCALAAAKTLYVPVLQSKIIGANVDFTGQNRLSGFSMLAAYLCEDKDRLRRLLGDSGIGLRPRMKTGKVEVIVAPQAGPV